MTLMLPLLAMFVVIGLTQTALSRKAYLRMGLAIVVVLAYYYFTYTPDLS